MLLINSFLFCGFVCLISQIILDNSKLTVGHITSILVVVGAFLDCFSIYDYIFISVGVKGNISKNSVFGNHTQTKFLINTRFIIPQTRDKIKSF